MSRHTHNWRFLGRWLCRTLSLAVVCGAVALAPQLAMAASGTWIGGTDTNWGNSANWSGGTIAGTNLTLVTTTANITDTATFNTATNLTVIPDANRYVASITFDTLAGNFTIGQSSGNTLYMAPGTVQIARTIRGTGLTETVAAPLNLYSLTPSTSATFNFFNNSPDPTNSLVISGNISSNLTATTSIELSGTSGFADQGPRPQTC